MRTTTLPIHPVTGLRALGWTRRGPIWPVMGGSGEGDGGTGDQGNADGTGSDQGSDDTGKSDGDAKDPGKDSGKGDDGAFDAARAQRLIDNLRGEITDLKAKHKGNADVLAAIAQAVNPDAKKGDQVDPKELTTRLTTTQDDLRAATVELAVFKAAAKHNADPLALTDSREFMQKVRALDPAAEGFASKVGDAIKKAVEGNARYAATQAPASSGPGINNGGKSGGGAKPTNLTEAVSARLGAGTG